MTDKINSVRDAWNTNAAQWDARVGDRNTFAIRLVAPAEESLLGVSAGDTILDVACGNGIHSRRLARRGAKVCAIDISTSMIDLARARTSKELDIQYYVVDATNPEDWQRVPQRFDAIVCHMAIFDMPCIETLFSAVAERLKPTSCFIVSSVHPCFNHHGAALFSEGCVSPTGEFQEIYGVRVTSYAEPAPSLGRAFSEQPVSHPMYHRPLSVILDQAFRSGFALTGLIEPTMPVDDTPGPALSWDARFSSIPPVIVFRFHRL